MADQFINIADSMKKLTLAEPAKFDEVKVNLVDSSKAPVETVAKITTKEELYNELKAMKEEYSPFLKSYSPVVNEEKEVIDIKEFVLNGEKKITIPEYEGPIGKARKVYETTFNLNDFSGKAVYICFDGADYEAFVYINDECVGTHEGFFSPFDFEITEFVKKGENTLKVVLKNDFVYMGNGSEKVTRAEGDKLYAATGIGWDAPELGWHHCPPGMGIYNNVRVEVRNRVNISDVFVRPLCDENAIEAWVEVTNADYVLKDLSFEFSIYGENFETTVFENETREASTNLEVGAWDTFTESLKAGLIGKPMPMPAEQGKNIYKIKLPLENFKVWDLTTPYLYALCVNVIFDGRVCDRKKSLFGMRTFTQDIETTPKGMFYLNGRKIKLHGANTMGFEQLDVLHGDFEQLIDDILLAKLCNMNFLRLTQRPVQKEVYDYCDRLGLMTQSDLPLFAVMRRTKVAEGIRQAEEMERLVRNHPCNIMVSYINEPMPNGNNKGHRHLLRKELEDFFDSCDRIVKLNNPDRVTKHVDGDYDPPSKLLPDNHCYSMWYNSHGMDIGTLIKGYWMGVKEDWYHGCGEYGAEGLDFCEVMREHYPKEWITEPFDPKNIVNAQSGNMHYMYFDTCYNMEDWVKSSHNYQAFATKTMTEAFRRDDKMVTNAIHLFIDAWPAGWMKTIMDFKRNPKKAYFAFRDALEPLMISLRSDRFTYFEGEEIKVECHICNDTQLCGDNYKIIYELYKDGEIIKSAEEKASVDVCASKYSSSAVFAIDKVNDREKFTLKAILADGKGNVLNHNTFDFEVFEDVEVVKNDNVEIITNLEVGEHTIAGEKVTVDACGMRPVHFVSRATGHKAVAEFKEKDFSYWYNKEVDYITPIAEKTFRAEGFTPILTSGNKCVDSEGWETVLIAAQKEYNGKKYIICLADLRTENPIAKRFLKNLYQ
ncbi:MAG: glycoside hydrolase family 2 [Clostridia bacterium]|nr:glycoside hydrolase family 2 [Clostridia bacterium]